MIREAAPLVYMTDFFWIGSIFAIGAIAAVVLGILLIKREN